VCRLYGGGNHALPIVLVDDVADAMLKAMVSPSSVGQTYNLAGAAGLTANDYLDEVERRAGIRLKRVPTPSYRAFAGALVKWAVKSAGGSDGLRPSYSDWRGRTFASPFDCSKARNELGWTPTDDRATVVSQGIHAPVDEFFR
jgi:nucleoside-diphosphate-sugar epimerase